MFNDKQEQNTGPNSTAIQAKEVTINKNGLSVSEVKELCLLFLRDNFPVLREEAIKAAEDNVQKFAQSLEERIVEKSEKIIFEKFADPDVQATINDAVQSSARKGEKAHPSTLVNLIVERASKENGDFQDIVISEAITIVPKITKEQMSYLSFIQYMTSTTFNISHISELEPQSKAILSVVTSGFNLSESQKRHLQYAGTCTQSQIISENIYEIWRKYAYKNLGYSNLQNFRNDLANYSPSSKILLDTFDKDINGGGRMILTSVGQAIAIAELSTVLGEMNYSIWLN